VAFLSWVFLIFAFGAADRIFVLWGLSYNAQLYIFRIGIWVVPPVLFFVVRRLCRELQASDRIARAAGVRSDRGGARASGGGGARARARNHRRDDAVSQVGDAIH
jgi:hypothetical protein